MKIYISKVLFSIFCFLTIISSEFILPLSAEEKWHEELLGKENNENKKTTSKEFSLLIIEAELAIKEQRYDDLLTIRKEKLKIIERDFGENNYLTGYAHLKVAEGYKILGRFKIAEFHYKKSLEILSKYKKEEPKALADSKNSLGLYYLEQGIYNKAEIQLEEALKIKEKEYGLNDIKLVNTLNNLAVLYNNIN